MTGQRSPAGLAAEKLSEPPGPGRAHSVPLAGTRRPGRSPIYRNWQVKDKPLVSQLDPAVRTIHELFDQAARRGPKNRCMGIRKWLPETQSWDDKYTWSTYAEIAERRRNFGAGLVEIHKRVRHAQDKYGVGLWCQNKPEWHITDLACMSQSLYSVSLYETLGPDTTEHIVNHAELTCVVCSTQHIPELLKLAPRLAHLKLIVSLDALDHGEPQGHSKGAMLNALSSEHGIQVYSMQQVEQIGRESGRPMRPVAPGDLYTINYTSGTTGPPKGVLLTHAATLAGNCASLIAGVVTSEDVGISYLPLAHIMERLAQHASFSEGASTGFFHGNALEMVEDMRILQPTAFVSVPRVYNRFFRAIKNGTVDAPGFRGTLSKRVLDTKLASMRLPMGQATSSHWLWDRVLTPRIKSKVGLTRASRMLSGSAPLDPKVQGFLSAMFGTVLHQGYGMTETGGLCTVSLRGDYDTGHVGPLSPCIEACLESIPDLGYQVDDQPFPRGELLVRGPSLFSGYYKDDEATSKTFEADGWFHTGDVAAIDQLGRLIIIDRIKHVLKLAQGEYVAPQRIENTYAVDCNLITMCFVHGDSHEASLVGIFGVNPETFAPFASQITGREIGPADIDGLRAATQDARVRREFAKILQLVGLKYKLNKYENVANFMLDVDPFTVENELLTPTLKLKRAQAAKAYRKDIDRMYAEMESQLPAKGKL